MDLKTANDIFTSIRETSLTSLKDELCLASTIVRFDDN